MVDPPPLGVSMWVECEAALQGAGSPAPFHGVGLGGLCFGYFPARCRPSPTPIGVGFLRDTHSLRFAADQKQQTNVLVFAFWFFLFVFLCLFGRFTRGGRWDRVLAGFPLLLHGTTPPRLREGWRSVSGCACECVGSGRGAGFRAVRGPWLFGCRTGTRASARVNVRFRLGHGHRSRSDTSHGSGCLISL